MYLGYICIIRLNHCRSKTQYDKLIVVCRVLSRSKWIRLHLCQLFQIDKILCFHHIQHIYMYIKSWIFLILYTLFRFKYSISLNASSPFKSLKKSSNSNTFIFKYPGFLFSFIEYNSEKICSIDSFALIKKNFPSSQLN